MLGCSFAAGSPLMVKGEVWEWRWQMLLFGHAHHVCNCIFSPTEGGEEPC